MGGSSWQRSKKLLALQYTVSDEQYLSLKTVLYDKFAVKCRLIGD
jgi:hypothetical protein